MRKISIRVQILGYFILITLSVIIGLLFRELNITAFGSSIKVAFAASIQRFLTGAAIYLIAKKNKIYNVIAFSVLCVAIDCVISWALHHSIAWNTLLKMAYKGSAPGMEWVNVLLGILEVILGGLVAGYVGGKFSKKAV